MPLQAGQLFGNYRIVRLLGEGGFGEVYLAENPLIERRAAVKVLHTALAQDTELVRRFLNEARAASAIRHRNIIEVFDAGVTPDGAPYILMEFLEGVSLQKRLAERGRLALPQVLEIARQAGSALGAAHAAGIVHRDLKPENLFLVPDAAAPNRERVKVLDFGIAKIRRVGGTGGTMRTQAGLIMGSPAYMSPEQCKDSADVDLRSDIYSFATIIYETLAGRTPHVAVSGTEMLVMHLSETPPSLHELVAGVPAHVEAAIMRALARAREDRFESIASFVGALRSDAGWGAAAPDRSSPSEDLPTFGESPVAGAEQNVAAPAITTLSRATGEVRASGSDDVLLTAARNRRWPVFAFGAGAVAGLAIFLWVRPSPDSATGTTLGTLGTAAADAAIVGSVVTARPDAGSVAVLAGRADGGAAPRVVTRVPPVGKPPLAVVPRDSAGVRPSSKPAQAAARQTNPPPATRPRRLEDPWVVH
jgi:eukaryotic-like serine/threonine-protein kinase